MSSFRMTVGMCNYETPCTHEASDSDFNEGQIMQCIVTYTTGMHT